MLQTSVGRHRCHTVLQDHSRLKNENRQDTKVRRLPSVVTLTLFVDLPLKTGCYRSISFDSEMIYHRDFRTFTIVDEGHANYNNDSCESHFGHAPN